MRAFSFPSSRLSPTNMGSRGAVISLPLGLGSVTRSFAWDDTFNFMIAATGTMQVYQRLSRSQG